MGYEAILVPDKQNNHRNEPCILLKKNLSVFRQVRGKLCLVIETVRLALGRLQVKDAGFVQVLVSIETHLCRFHRLTALLKSKKIVSEET